MELENELDQLPTEERQPTIIFPPPDIRAIIDKTAEFVATRGGLELEEKIREKELYNPKFAFLNLGDPYHAYYGLKLRDFREGRCECIYGFSSFFLASDQSKNVCAESA